MDAIEIIHNAARLYCIERAAEQQRRYSLLAATRRDPVSTPAGREPGFSDEARDTFPRYRVLDAIKSDVEHFVPRDFGSVAELRELLTIAGETANRDLPGFDHPVEAGAAEDERRRFVAYVRSVDAGELAGLRRLPFRRVLGGAEHRALHTAFGRRWGNWYGGGVDPVGAPADAVTLHEAAMEALGAYDALREILIGRGFARLMELREWGDGAEVDTCCVDFYYNGAEGFWTAGEMEWMVYASHESSITFGGAWLVDAMRQQLPEFDRYLYRSWDRSVY